MLSLLSADSAPLAEQLLVAATGPAVTAVFGGLVVWAITSRLSERADMRRSERESRRVEAERQVERLRARSELENKLRLDLLDALLDCAARQYIGMQHYWRQAGRDRDLTVEQLAAERAQLDATYLETHARSLALEAKLEAVFKEPEPELTWHAIDDLLTVRYMQLIGRATESLYRENSKDFQGKAHSGLSISELRDPKTLLGAYHVKYRELVSHVLSAQLR
jgi:hypothetical protein